MQILKIYWNISEFQPPKMSQLVGQEELMTFVEKEKIVLLCHASGQPQPR